MPTYKSTARLSDAPREFAEVLMNVVEHARPMGYSVTGISLSTGQLSITVSKTLTATERAHLGLA